MLNKYIVINIGCIECGVSTNIVGVFKDKDNAQQVADKCNHKYEWREGGQNAFEVFQLPNEEIINSDYDI